MSSPRTVRVKIGVAVDGNGKYSGFGYTGMDLDGLYEAADTLDVNVRYFWLEADLPKPEIETRMAQEVTEDKKVK
jgi:hypothetical protein